MKFSSAERKRKEHIFFIYVANVLKLEMSDQFLNLQYEISIDEINIIKIVSSILVILVPMKMQ